MFCVQVIITDLGEIGENAIIVFEENVGVGAEEIVANQEFVTYTGDSEEVLEVKINNNNSRIIVSSLSHRQTNWLLYCIQYFNNLGRIIGEQRQVRSRSRGTV